jgi:hypothetical protein
MPDKKLTTLDIEIAVMEFFGVRQNLIVPNVYWGMGFSHELDLLVITKSGYGIEIEIKISRSDMIADTKKSHKHNSPKIKRLYFAIPETLLDSCFDLIPDEAGILIVKQSRYGYYLPIKHREAKIKSRYKFSESERDKLLHLAAMRIITMKRQMRDMKESYNAIL